MQLTKAELRELSQKPPFERLVWRLEFGNPVCFVRVPTGILPSNYRLIFDKVEYSQRTGEVVLHFWCQSVFPECFKKDLQCAFNLRTKEHKEILRQLEQVRNVFVHSWVEYGSGSLQWLGRMQHDWLEHLRKGIARARKQYAPTANSSVSQSLTPKAVKPPKQQTKALTPPIKAPAPPANASKQNVSKSNKKKADKRSITFPVGASNANHTGRSIENVSVDNLVQWGITQLARNKFPEASRYFQKALSKQPGSIALHMKIAEVCFKHQYYEEAGRFYRSAIQLQPSLKQVYKEQTDVLCSGIQKLVDGAVNGANVERSLTIACKHLIQFSSGSVAVHIIAGKAFYKANLFSQASVSFVHAIRQAPEYKEMYERYLVALIQQGKKLQEQGAYIKAMHAFKGATLFDAKNARAYYLLAECCYEAEKYREALLAYQHALDLDKSYMQKYAERIDQLYHLVEAYCAQKAFIRAAPILEAMNQFFPDDARVHVYSGKVFYESQMFESAGDSYRKALLHDPFRAQEYEQRVKELSRKVEGLWSRATVDSTELVSSYISLVQFMLGEFQYAQPVEGWAKRSKVFYESAQYEKALALLRQNLSTKPSSGHALLMYGLVLLAMRQFSKAFEAFKEFVLVEQTNLDNYLGHATYTSMGKELYKLGDVQEACEAFEQALSLNPNSSDTYVDYGNVLFRLKNYEKAGALYAKAVGLNPAIKQIQEKQVMKLVRSGDALVERKQYVDALAVYQNALMFMPGHAEATLGAAKLLCQLERYAEAYSTFQLADWRKISILFTWYIQQRQDLYSKCTTFFLSKNYEKALAYSEKLLQFSPDDKEGYSVQASALEKLGRLEEAKTVKGRAAIAKSFSMESAKHEGWLSEEPFRYD